MKLKMILFITILCYVNLFAQKKYSGKVLDAETLQPIEFANVFNIENYTITNEDGKFDFSSKNDSIKFKCLGYTELKTTITQLSKDSIIKLMPKFFALDEIIISNQNTSLDKINNAIENDYPSSEFNEEFFLRCILKKNDSIIKIQDLNGVVNRKTLFATSKKPMPKKNYTVYLNNMRKAGYKEEKISLKLFDLETVFNAFVIINKDSKKYTYKKAELKDSTLIKLNFTPKSTNKKNRKGHYIINTIDNSLNQIYYTGSSNFKTVRKFKYRTSKYEILVNFFKDELLQKDRINTAKLNFIIDLYDELDTKIRSYTITYIYKTTKRYNTNNLLENKVSIKKDHFKIKHPFDKNYWNSNNTLKLTDEMSDFIKTLEESDLETVTNFKK